MNPIVGKKNKYIYIPATWKKEIPLRYIADNNKEYILDEKFETDLASIPRMLWNVPGFSTGDYIRPALVHDWLFQLNHYKRPIVDFKKSNDLLYEMLRSEGASKFISWSYKNACNLFGKSIWDGN